MIRQLIYYESPQIFDVFVNYFGDSLRRLYSRSAHRFLLQEGLDDATLLSTVKVPLGVEEIALFYPELLSETALSDLTKTLDNILQASDQVISVHIVAFFSSVWALQSLKDHPLFKKGAIHLFSLSINDKLRDFPMLQVLQELDPAAKEQWHEVRLYSKEFKAKRLTTIQDIDLLFSAGTCFKAFF